MLVLSRKEAESIIIGNGSIEIIVVAIKGGKVKLGINAPKEVSVHREEVHKAINKSLNQRTYYVEADEREGPNTGDLEDRSDSVGSGGHRQGDPVQYHDIFSQSPNLSYINEMDDFKFGSNKLYGSLGRQ